MGKGPLCAIDTGNPVAPKSEESGPQRPDRSVGESGIVHFFIPSPQLFPPTR